MNPPVNFESLTFGVSTVQWIITFAIGIYAWFVGRLSASAKEVTELRLRMTVVETALKQAPSKDMVNDVRGRLEKLDAEMNSNNRELKAINASLNRINDYLLNNK